jgi:toxin ParE1/3/4
LSIHVELSPQFRRDVIDQYCWYAEQQDEELAQRFRAAVTATLLLIREEPKIGPLCLIAAKSLNGMRYFRVEPPFDKLLLFYRLTDSSLQAVRLLHGMRDLPRRLRESRK